MPNLSLSPCVHRSTAVLISDCRLLGKPPPRLLVAEPSSEPVKCMLWKSFPRSKCFRNVAKCPLGMGRLLRHSTLAIVSLRSETDTGRIRSLRCICRLSLLKIENKSARKWQNAVKCTSFILAATNLARPWISAFFEVVLRCSMWNNTAAYCLTSSPQKSLAERPTNTLNARVTWGNQRVPLTWEGFKIFTSSSSAMDLRVRTDLGL